MSHFRLLHASDLHLSQTPDPLGLSATFGPREPPAHFGGHDASLIKGLAWFSHEHQTGLDAILLGGNLAATGSEGDVARAREFVAGTGATGEVPWLTDRGHPTLGGALEPRRIFVLPGNHDRYQNATTPIGGRAFDRVFADSWMAGQGAQLYPTLVKDRRALQVVGLDLSLRSAADASSTAGAFGQGRCYQETVTAARHLSQIAKTELVRRGEVISEADVAVVWLTHFAPLFPRARRTLDLLEGELLIYEASRAGVLGLLCGHTHLVQRYEARVGERSLQVHCTGSAGHRGERQDAAFQMVSVHFDHAGTAHLATESVRWSQEDAGWRLPLRPQPSPLHQP